MYRFPLRGRCANRKNSVQIVKFVLKQYDTELISFDLQSEGLDDFVCFVPVILQRIRKSSVDGK